MITTKYHLHPPGKSWAGFSCSPGPDCLPGFTITRSRPVKTPQNAAGAICLPSNARLQYGNIPAYPDTKTQHRPGKLPRTQYTQKQQPRPAPENAVQAARTPNSAQTAPAECIYTTQPQQGQQRRPQDAQTTPGPAAGESLPRPARQGGAPRHPGQIRPGRPRSPLSPGFPPGLPPKSQAPGNFLKKIRQEKPFLRPPIRKSKKFFKTRLQKSFWHDIIYRGNIFIL